MENDTAVIKKEYIKVEAYISYKDQFLRIEEIGGMDEKFIVFNPEDRDGFLDYKIQFTEKVYLRIKNSKELVSLRELDKDFVIINSRGQEIISSDDFREEFIISILDMILKKSEFNQEKEFLN